MNDANSPSSESDGAAVFGFDDLQALREEYEERIRQMKAEHEAHPKGAGLAFTAEASAAQLIRDEYEERIRVMKIEHEARIKSEGTSRQELITDLTFELAAAREEGELRARTAEARGAGLETELRNALTSLRRIEVEVMRVKLALEDAISPTGVTRLPEPPVDAPRATPPTSSLPTTTPPTTTPPMTAPPTLSVPPWAAPALTIPTAPPTEVAVQGADVVASEPEPSRPVSVPPMPVDPSPASTAAGARRKRIRLR